MQICKTISETRAAIAQARQAGQTIGFVPTMGALHQGHFSLVSQSCAQCDFTVVSIFVNPTQFGPNEDLNAYPRTFDADCQGCQKLGADLIFAPSAAEMYPKPNLTWINVEKLTEHLCGTSRPTHFRGVCTVVAKLLNIVQPDRAYFGQKDAQQLAVIQRMVADLNFPTTIVPCATVREEDGLAMSSRNAYLSHEQRRLAPVLYQTLQNAAELIKQGNTNATDIIAAMTEKITTQTPGQIDYISIVDKELLHPVATIEAPVLIALAVRIGKARLIDNIVVDPS
ncbi:MAG: pantoate--beta-alanine ligase [Sedimentisphaerales bacterium]|nr:pantoate--beta-alanine ligase [Sedimentisphaerales bacterium]